jgi:hypothetical protein
VELRVRYAGVPIGTATLDALTGLAHSVLVPGAGYELARDRVETAGRFLAPRGIVAEFYWPPAHGDFADSASTLAGGYELEDLRGMPVSAASVVVFAPRGSERQPIVVMDFRPQAAHVFAELPERDASGGGRRRPAA